MQFLKIPTTSIGEKAPFGLSRASEYLRLRLPVLLTYGKRYDLINDEFDTGWWTMNVVCRFYHYKIEIHWGWGMFGKKRARKWL